MVRKALGGNQRDQCGSSGSDTEALKTHTYSIHQATAPTTKCDKTRPCFILPNESQIMRVCTKY